MTIEEREHLRQFMGETLIDMWPRHSDEQYVLMFSNGKKLILGIYQTPGGYHLPTLEVEDK